MEITEISSADKHCIIFINLNLIIYSFGVNTKPLPQIKSFLRLLWEQSEDSTLRILFIAATLTLIIGLFSDRAGAWIEGASIYFAIAFIALFASSCDYMKEK